ncbi:MAG: ParB/RepB/Spo0J family partition protein [Pseudomonadota bacterium]|nr:ParB/RepB/Spo0J family partition protein [Pseudomonadota bacterium]
MVKKRRLGKGLDALLSAQETVNEIQSVDTDSGKAQQIVKELPVEWLSRGRYQPRRHMAQEQLEELAESIKAQGIMQPLVVRELSEAQFEIIAGERRWRAAQIAGLETVPCLIREVDDEATIAMAIIENIQRENLNSMEEAIALDRLAREFDLTHQQTANAVGKSRTSVSNLLRLLSLELAVREQLERGDIELGHAKVLLSLKGQPQVQAAKQVALKALTVRETENLVKHWGQEAKSTPTKAPIDPNIGALEQKLSDLLAAKVDVKHSTKGKGKLVIQYASLDELDGIIEKISGQKTLLDD